MKAAAVAASVALVGSVAASHNNHAGLHFRRHADSDICTVYTTVYVTASEMPPMASNSTVMVEPSPVPESSTNVESFPILTSTEVAYTPVHTPSSSEVAYTPAPVPEPSEEAQPSKNDYPEAPVHTPEPSSEAPVHPPEPSHEAPSTSEAAEHPEPSQPSGDDDHEGGRIVTNGKKWAITYTPYAPNGDCKTAMEVKTDISKIADMGFTTIRSYSTDCGVFENVVPECEKHGLKIIYGIFLEGAGKGAGSDYANQQLQDIIDNAPKDSVAMVIVGNECMFNNNCQPAELGAYIDYVRKELQGAGFPSDIAVTTTEPVNVWEEKGQELCSHIDVFTVQVHPFFTQSVSASSAGNFAAQQLEQAAKVCPEVASKGKYITEIGWPKDGQSNGQAHPGVQEQKEAIESIMDKVGDEACLFSFQDDLWKNPGSLGVEQSFGCAEAF